MPVLMQGARSAKSRSVAADTTTEPVFSAVIEKLSRVEDRVCNCGPGC